MRNYWSCSKFSDWLRGTPKLTVGSAKQWKDWKANAKSAHPIRYWLAEDGLNKLQDVVMWPLDQLHSAKYYFNNRWITRTHALTAHPRDIPRGEWREYGTRILPCLFNELVNFVEIDQAAMNIIWDEAARKKYKAPWWSFGWFRVRTWRSAEAGVEHLKWAASLTNEEWLDEGEKHLAQHTGQAIAAKEVLELYHWWTVVRPNRPDPGDASGWTAWCHSTRSNTDDVLSVLDSSNETPEQRETSNRILDAYHEIEKNYENEDTEMLVRLIRIRYHLWT